MSGIDFCLEFRKLDRQSYGYFILLTSKSDKADIAVGLDVGADDFLSKPVNTVELRSRLMAGQRILEMEQAVRTHMLETQTALTKVEQLYTEIEKDLLEAAKLQQSLIPPPTEHLGNVTVSNFFKSSGHVGGDLLGYFMIEEDRLGMYSIDVSGHGVSSALLTVRLSGYFTRDNKPQNIVYEGVDTGGFSIRAPHEVAARLNEMLLKDLNTELYLTMAYADVDIKTGQCHLVQAGHPHPIMLRSDGVVERLGDGGPPIGMLENMNYQTVSVNLRNGDRLLLYTDGITECENVHGELLDDHGLEKLLTDHHQSTTPNILTEIMSTLTTHAQGCEHNDDLSAIALEFNAA